MGFLKVFTPLFLAAVLLSSLAHAAPAPRRIKARDYVTEVVTETVWTTVDITTTVYVDELPSTSVPAPAPAEVTSSAEETDAEEISSAEEIESGPPSTSASAASTTLAPEPTSPALPVSEPASSEEAVAEPSDPAGEFVETSAPPPPVYTPPPPPPAPVSAPEPVYTPAAAPEPAPAPVSAPAPMVEDVAVSSAASETASCQDGTTCKGDITWYEGGLGACGQTVDTEAEMAIALPFGFMGTLSNSNPYCGMSVTVKNPVSGTTVQGTVRDKCMGCVGRSIDLTSKMFQAVTDGKGDGRVHNIEWWFN